MRILNGAEIAGYMKENQAHQVKTLWSNRIHPKLVIIRDSDNPVITKYVNLKQSYGEDIGVVTEDWWRADVSAAIDEANKAEDVHGLIVQLPISKNSDVDEVLSRIAPEKDVDGLAEAEIFESATATAINWLVSGYEIPLNTMKIAIVGRGRLVGRPLARMWRNSGYDVAVFHRGDDLSKLRDFDLVVSATGVPHLIRSEMIKPGAVVVDAGTASENGVLMGDVDDAVRERSDLMAITPKIGGVGPLTVTALFEHVLIAAKKKLA